MFHLSAPPTTTQTTVTKQPATSLSERLTATEQAQQLTNDQLTNYNKARNVCLDAKGYSVSN